MLMIRVFMPRGDQKYAVYSRKGSDLLILRIRVADTQESRFQASKHSNMGSAALEGGHYANIR